MRKIIKFLQKFLDRLGFFIILEKKDNVNKLILGKILINQLHIKGIVNNLQEIEFSIFSQFGDDGIIQYLINNIDITNKTFIEFGVEDYKESNTRFLLLNNNWSGMIIDGSKNNIDKIKIDSIYWKYDIQAFHYFITKENINEILSLAKFEKNVGLLHIDIDGNDYWIWKEIQIINPIIVIVEYNSVFGIDKAITIPYIEDFNRTNYHYSNLCFGSSLTSLNDLAEEKGYSFIGCNSNGNNAYFIRNDKLNNIPKIKIKDGYVYSKFRESFNQNKESTFLRDTERLEILKGVELFDTRLNKKIIL